MNKTISKKSRKSKEKTPPQCGVIMKNSPPGLEAVTTSRGAWVEIQKKPIIHSQPTFFDFYVVFRHILRLI